MSLIKNKVFAQVYDEVRTYTQFKIIDSLSHQQGIQVDLLIEEMIWIKIYSPVEDQLGIIWMSLPIHALKT